MLKNLKVGDRFVDEIGRVFLVKKVISGGYETEFIGLTDYEEGQKPYKLDAEKSEDEKQEAGRKKGGRKTNKQEEENQQTDDTKSEGEDDKDIGNGEGEKTGSETPEDEKKSEEDK